MAEKRPGKTKAEPAAKTARELVTQAEYARRVGCSRSAVNQWVKKGLIKLNEDGLIDPVAADRARAAVREPARPRRSRGRADDSTPETDDRLLEARIVLEQERGRMARLKADELEGLLLDAEQVRSDFYAAASIVRQSLRSIPARLANQVFACESPHEVLQLLANEIDQALDQLADHFEQTSAPDLDDDDLEDFDDEDE